MGIGIALGGVAQGLESAEKALLDRDALKQRGMAIAADDKLRSRALDIQSKQEDRLANQDILSQADTIIGDQLKIVGEVIKAGKEANHTPEQIAAAIEPIMADVDRLSAGVGRDSKIYRSQVQASLAAPGKGTPAEKGAKSAQEKVAERDALVQAGVPKHDADVAAGLAQNLSKWDQMLLDAQEQAKGADGGSPISAAMPKGTFATEDEFLQAVNTGRLKVQAGDKVVVNGIVRTVTQ